MSSLRANGRLKIAHVLPALTKGGAEKVAVDLANYFALEHTVAIVSGCRADPDLLQTAVKPEVDLRFISDAPPGKHMYASVVPWVHRNWPWIARMDVIHCHLTFGSAFGALVTLNRKVRGLKRPKVLETYHAVGMPMSPFRWRLASTLAASHDGFVTMASDPAIAAFVRQHPDQPYQMIPNGISLPFRQATSEERDQYREGIGIPAGALVVGTVGRLITDRRPDKFIEVFKFIAKARSDVHFLMAGDGPESRVIMALARDVGLEGQLHLPGLARRAELPFSVIDLYLTLNVGEITGIAALEAIASNLPVIAYQADTSHWGEEDWIFSSADPRKVAAQALRLLESPRQLAALAAAQRERLVRNHSLKAMAEAYRKFYVRLLADG